jgi:hypothetical protein
MNHFTALILLPTPSLGSDILVYRAVLPLLDILLQNVECTLYFTPNGNGHLKPREGSTLHGFRGGVVTGNTTLRLRTPVSPITVWDMTSMEGVAAHGPHTPSVDPTGDDGGGDSTADDDDITVMDEDMEAAMIEVVHRRIVVHTLSLCLHVHTHA